MVNNEFFLLSVFHLVALHQTHRNRFLYFLSLYFSHKHLSFHVMLTLCYIFFMRLDVGFSDDDLIFNYMIVKCDDLLFDRSMMIFMIRS